MPDKRTVRRVPQVTADELRDVLAKHGHAVSAAYMARLVWWGRGGRGQPNHAASKGAMGMPPVVKDRHVKDALAELLDAGQVVSALGHEVAKIGGTHGNELRHNVVYYALNLQAVPDATWAYLRLLRHQVMRPAPATYEFVDRLGPVEALDRIEELVAPAKVLSEVTHTGGVEQFDLTAVRAGQQRDAKLIESGFARLVTPGMAEWPAAQLSDVGTHQPLALWVRGRGDLAALTDKAVSVVGSRAVSKQGAGRARLLAHAAVDRGYTVVSGGAFGVDTHAHQGALARGGATVVVLPCGVGKSYPSGNADLFDQVVEAGGLLVSEYPPDVGPDRAHFLQRNRLVAALGAQTLVVEANARSGTLNTARTAHRYRRPVFVAAGSPGCNQLLTEGTAWPMRDLDHITHALTGDQA